MGKMLITADLHAHNFEPFAKPTEFGYNTRLYYILQVFKELEKEAKANKCTTLVILGDLFHTRVIIDTVVYVEVFEALRRLSQILTIYILKGNHDCASKDGHHALDPLADKNIIIVNSPSLINIEGTPCYFIPYISDPKLIKETLEKAPPADVLFGHFTATTATPPKMLSPLKEGVDLNENKKIRNKFDFTFLGHFHNFQEIFEKGYYVGAPIHHNFGDSEDRKYFIAYDGNAKSIKKIDVTSRFPRFRQFVIQNNPEELEAFLEDCKSHDYVQIINRSEDDTKIKKQIPEGIVFINESNIESVARTNITSNMSFTDILKEYVDTFENIKFDKKRLLEIGTEIVNEV